MRPTRTPGPEGRDPAQGQGAGRHHRGRDQPDPAWDYEGLLWDYRRIGLPQGWKTTAGSSKVTVAVADTGLDYTHRELGPRVKRVVDFTGMEDPPSCETAFGISDEDLAAEFGGPVDTDSGASPDVSTPEGQLIYQAYVDAVAYARSKGTIIVASAGNQHVRVGAGGRVLSHGQLSTPGDPADDWPDPSGQLQLPGGTPGRSTSPPATGSTSRPRPAARRAPSVTRATPTPTRPSRRTTTPPASR